MACKYTYKNIEFNSKEEFKKFLLKPSNIGTEIIAEITDEVTLQVTPYKTTDQWAGLTVRKIIQTAIEEGFDSIAWTTGEQQGARYSLRNKVDYIEYWKNDNDTYGFATSSEFTKPSELTAKDLESYLGKEIAIKIVEDTSNPSESKPGKLEGDDLEVGGEGMVGFYDKIIPSIFKQEARRFDKKITLTKKEIRLRDKDNPLDNQQLTGKLQADIVAYYTKSMNLVELEDSAAKAGLTVKLDLMGDPQFFDANLKPSTSMQMGMDITPELRMNTHAAMPLFQAEKAAMVAADSKYIIYALTNPNVSSPLHELAHVYENYLQEAEVSTILKWTEQKAWDTTTSEKFARGFEAYLAEGKSPIKALQAIFDNFRTWLIEIYDGLTGSEIDIELNDPMRLIYAQMLGGNPIEVYRGEGNNFAPGVNEGLRWVAADKLVAENYATKSKGAFNLETSIIENPKNLLKLLYRGGTQVTGQNIGEHLNRKLSEAVKNKQIGLEWKAIRVKINKYEELAGSEPEAYGTKISKPSVNKIFAEILSDLGIDAVQIMENGAITYGLVKQPQYSRQNTTNNDTKDTTGVPSTVQQKNSNTEPTFEKGERSTQGNAVVTGGQLQIGEKAWYNSIEYKITDLNDVDAVLSNDSESIKVSRDKVLAENSIPTDTREFSPAEVSPGALNDVLLNDAVFNAFRENNLEPSDSEVIGVSAYVKVKMDGKTPVSDVISEAVAKFQKKGVSPIASRVTPTATGSKTTTPNMSYNEAVRNNNKQKGSNLWVRNESTDSNKDRVLMVQFSSDFLYGKAPFKRSLNSKYFDALYRLIPGYNRSSDFWEVPLWMAKLAGMESKSDVYVIRDINEAKKFIKEAGYSRVAFSALDVNEKDIREIASSAKEQTFSIGGYTNFNALKAMPNVATFNTIAEYATKYGVRDTGNYSYRHFKDTAVIPRLKLSEGCKYKCAFCSIPKKVISVSEEEFNKAVESMADLDATLVYLDDKTFGQASNFRALPGIYKKIKETNPDFQGFIIQTTSVDFADNKKFDAKFLKESGIKFVELGIETYNDDILTKLNKKHSHKKFTDAAMQKGRENGVKIIPNIIVGLSWTEGNEIYTEDVESYRNTMDFLNANKDVISHLNVYSLAIYEGTELGDSIEVKEESDKNENVTTKSWQKNQETHVWAMDAFSQFALDQVENTNTPVANPETTGNKRTTPVRLGRVRYNETPTEITVESSLLAPLTYKTRGNSKAIKGMGIGTGMYAELVKYALQVNKPLRSSSNLTAESIAVWDKLTSMGISKKIGDRYEISNLPEDFDRNGEPSLSSVMKFTDKQGVKGILEVEELSRLKETMIGIDVKSSYHLLVLLQQGFFSQGEFKPTREALNKTNLYSSEEITDILSDGNLQAVIKEFILKLENTDIEVLNDTYVDENYLATMDGAKNEIGQFQVGNPYTFEQFVINKIGGIKDRQEFEDTLFEDEDLDAIVDTYINNRNTNNDIFYNLMDFNSAAEISIGEQGLEAKTTGTKEYLETTLLENQDLELLDNINVLLDLSANIWEESPKEVATLLKAVEGGLINMGVDVVNLDKVAVKAPITATQTFLQASKNLILAETDIIFNEFVNAYDVLFEKDANYKYRKVRVPRGATTANLITLNTQESKINLFTKYGLIAVGTNVYTRVNKNKSVDEVYDLIYSEMARNGYSNVLSFRALPEIVFDDDGSINMQKLSDPTLREPVIAGIRGAIQEKTRDIFRDTELVDSEMLEKFVLYHNYINRSNDLDIFEAKPNVSKEYEIYRDEISNIEYLTTDFISDFNVKLLKEKAKNSDLFNNVYKNLEINRAGINVISTDPINMYRLKAELANNTNLKNYFRLKKGGVSFTEVELAAPNTDKTFMRNYYANFPTNLKSFEGDITYLSSNTIAVNSREEFIRTSSGIFEFNQRVKNSDIYTKLATNSSEFKDYNTSLETPDIDVDLQRLKQVDVAASELQFKNSYSVQEGKTIKSNIDNC